MCNLETEQELHLPAGDDTLAMELILYVRSGALLKLRAHLTSTGVTWTYELGSALDSALDSKAGSVATP